LIEATVLATRSGARTRMTTTQIETPNERYQRRCMSVMQLWRPENFFSFLRLPSHGRKLHPPAVRYSLVFFFPLKSPQTTLEKSHGGHMSSNLQVSTVLW